MTTKLNLLDLSTAKKLAKGFILTGGKEKQHSDDVKKSYQGASRTSAGKMVRPAIIAATIITLSTTTNAIVEEKGRKDAALANRPTFLARDVKDARPSKVAPSVRVGTLSSDTNAGSPSGDGHSERTILIIQ